MFGIRKKILSKVSNTLHYDPINVLMGLNLLIFLSLGAQKTQAQNDNSLSDYSFTERLWYGGSVVLGYNSGPTYNQFQFGLSPMVGYKLTPAWSIGPRIEGIYQYYKINTGNSTEVVQPFTYSFSGFTRLKFLDILFGHVEYGVTEDRYPVIIGSEVTVYSETNDVLLIGGGYNAGGRVSGELSILYNVLENSNSLDIPFYFRAGITVNF